jgi:hypothetical protein
MHDELERAHALQAKGELRMKTLDLKKHLRYLYSPSAKQVEAVQVPPLQFAMIDGRIEESEGPSTSPGFQAATMAIYGIAYTLKFMLKKRPRNPVDYPVMALEGLWWVEDGVFDIARKDNWRYTLMILMPDAVSPDIFATGLADFRRKRGDDPTIGKLRLAEFDEGLCMQVMHVGAYADEPATAERMAAFARASGYADLVGSGGKHHEIYLGDPRRANPANLKTILRHPIKKVK